MQQWREDQNTMLIAMFLSLLVACSLIFPIGGAQANTTLTDRQIAQGFSCAGGGASGSLISDGGCGGGAKDGKILSKFVCEFENIVAETLGATYCAINDDARVAVIAALTLAVTLFGALFLMGVSPFTAKELMIMAGKYSMVLAFATEAEYMIGVGYKLFMAFSKEGIVIVISHLFQGQNFNGLTDVLEFFDEKILEVFQEGSKEAKDGNQCKSAIFALIAIVAAALPPLFFVAVYFMVKLLWMVLRAIFGYCQGILVVSFLVTLAPIYVSFALFKPTRTLFDKWVQYLISFSFQMVIVFAFLGMVFSILDKMADDAQSYMDLVKPYDKEMTQNGFAMPFNMCGVCEITQASPKDPPKCKSNKAMPVGQMAQNKEFLHFASVKVIAMVIMFYILDIMMDFVPQMARHLAGPKYAGQIGGGDTGGQTEVDVSMPGEKQKDAFLAGFTQGMAKGGAGPNAMARGFTTGLEWFMLGSPAQGGRKAYTGVLDSMIPLLGAAGLIYGVGKVSSVARPTPGGGRSSGPIVGASDGGPSESDDQLLQQRANERARAASHREYLAMRERETAKADATKQRDRLRKLTAAELSEELANIETSTARAQADHTIVADIARDLNGIDLEKFQGSDLASEVMRLVLNASATSTGEKADFATAVAHLKATGEGLRDPALVRALQNMPLVG
ncbi:MAG: type IV secretion system protein [Rickettsiales bacterium]|nr:type IV secretion system protein [Rickettsiales bacterium]